MSTESPEEQVARLLRELADEREKRLPPVGLGPVERTVLLREIERTLARPQRRESLWGLWLSRFWPALALGATAGIVLLAVVIMGTGRWQRRSPGASGRMELALRWPAGPALEAAVSKAWRPAQTALPQDLPDFGSSSGTLGAASSDPTFLRWRLATVIVRGDSGFGSGAFISAKGWVLSSYRVVADAAQKAAVDGRPATLQLIAAQIIDGRLKPRDPPLRATLYRADPRHDLALLNVEAWPEGGDRLPFLALAEQVRDGEECFMVGSQPNGPAWWVRSGNVSQQCQYPQGFSRGVAGAASAPADAERTRATVVVSDALMFPGDAGGPLLNGKGELIGVTLATATNLPADKVVCHIALRHLRDFLAALPSRPEGVPWDPWTAGLPGAVVSEPELADGDGDGRIDSLRYRHVSLPTGGPTNAPQQTVALTLFVDFAQRTAHTGDALDTIPAGLWGMEERGRFRFDLFLTTRADGLAVVGYANRQGIVDEIRVGRAGVDTTGVLWRRDNKGQWQSSTPAPAMPLVDAARLGATNLRRLQTITSGILAAPTRPPVPNNRTP